MGAKTGDIRSQYGNSVQMVQHGELGIDQDVAEDVRFAVIGGDDLVTVTCCESGANASRDHRVWSHSRAVREEETCRRPSGG